VSEENKPEEEPRKIDPILNADDDKPDEARLPGSSVKTSMLSMGDAAEQMQVREPRPNTAMLSLGWRLIFKIGDQKKTLPINELIVVGRAVDSDVNKNEINFDLTPHGAYHFGVSRRHSQMTLKEGYLYLEDLGSTNGTRINGFQLTANQKYRLRDGDEIEFARLRTSIQFKGPDQP
jgi:FHA domain